MTKGLIILVVLFLGQLFQGQKTFAQNYQFDDGQWINSPPAAIPARYGN